MDAGAGCSMCSTSSAGDHCRPQGQGDQCDRRSVRPPHPARYSRSRPGMPADDGRAWYPRFRVHMYQAERDAALAKRNAAAARMFQLQEQVKNYTDAMALKDARVLQLQERLERFERNRADAMAEASRIQAAEREAATARIRKLEANLQAHRQAHLDSMAEREAVIARIMELERFIAEPVATKLLRRLGHVLPGRKRIVGQKCRHLFRSSLRRYPPTRSSPRPLSRRQTESPSANWVGAYRGQAAERNKTGASISVPSAAGSDVYLMDRLMERAGNRRQHFPASVRTDSHRRSVLWR
jgi:hypothetical protein